MDRLLQGDRALLLWQAVLPRPDASVATMVPAHHPFIQNTLRFENELRPLRNTVLVKTVESFAAWHSGPQTETLLVAGNAGIEAATNAVVAESWRPVLFLVYGIVAALLLMEFRSVRVTLCLLIPLVITSLLCEAVMPVMGLAVKAAALPVTALGVGIGVDYAIYL